MTKPTLSPNRRDVLRWSLALGGACSIAASPLRTPVAFARAPGENRLVVIVLRGAMDGLDALAPYGDPAYAALRPTLKKSPGAGATDLDGYFALHDGLSGLLPLWRAGELGAVHAVATPYRDKRSHFDGQDILESGAPGQSALRDGWLNRALATIPGAPSRAEVRYAMAVGRSQMLLLDGDEPSGSWAPSTRLHLDQDERGLLSKLYAADPDFHAIAEEAFDIGAQTDGAGGKRRGQESGKALAKFAGDMLNETSRIAAFSIGGWDTHRAQKRAMRAPMKALSEAVLTLRETLRENWRTTAVVAITEFGRTARENGDLGTDHGTAGAVLLAGGAVKGGRVRNGPQERLLPGWPGLGEKALYRNRDLQATMDLRRIPAWALINLMGAPKNKVEATVFPGLELGPEPDLFA